MTFCPDTCRKQFPALSRRWMDRPVVYFDGPAGSQVPSSVIDAIGNYLRQHNANHGGVFLTSRESDAVVDAARMAAADFVGTSDPHTVIFGANMTTLTFAFSRALATRWQPGDEVVVTRLDHDANVTPWTRAAQDRGVTVQHVDIHPEDCTLDLDDFRHKLSNRTKLVAVGCASNAVGTRNQVQAIAKLAHEVGALVFLDAVHHAPHALIDVDAWDCDFLTCSAYKFFGPHIGILWGRRELLETLPAYKVRPCPETLPDRWMTGTQNFECIAGVGAAIDYLASLGEGPTRRAKLQSAFAQIERYERDLGTQLIRGLTAIPNVKIWGITDERRFADRVPTISITHAQHTPTAVAEYLADRGIFVWHGNYYALPLTERLGLEPEGMVRIGLLHYNTASEVDDFLEAMRTLG